ncbi:solute carrier family 13 member 2-like [Acipenser ruthenus]|uniref:solute carrier family 13 member 2-like n=1 Tax=Acipenser ruthenus TaxID=7906 RepID=UPI002740AECF|nr:solute carrier family 13 member 2-like [Acipenser ruthenus]
MGSFCSWVWAYRNYLIIFLIPLLLLPLPLAIPTKEAYCGYAIGLMALYWCTEALPLAVTALLPVVLFPMMGIMESGDVCMQYLKDTNMLFLGGLLVAIGVEQWNLHKRIALRVLTIVGVKPALLMMGFMGTTAFLSMWISNTATTAMMVPIAQAVLEQLDSSEAEADQLEIDNGQMNSGYEPDEKPAKSEEAKDRPGNGHVMSIEEGEGLAEERRQIRKEKYINLSKGMSLSVCYAASIGGTATLTGTTPNLILKGQIDELFPANGDVVNFATWFGFAFPNMMLMLVLAWFWLQFMFMGFNFKETFGCGGQVSEKDRKASQVIKDELKKLGSMTFAEGGILTVFVLLVVLWFTREPGFMPGWATVLFNKDGKQFVTDGTVAIFMALVLFVIPSKLPSCFCSGGGREGEESQKIKAPKALLDWDTVHQKMPWNILLLLGGGFALAKGSEASGLSVWMGHELAPLQSIPPAAIAVLLCLLVATFTECSSNVATTTLFLPILASMAQEIELHPLYIMLPCTLCASLAFMLPVATPPNAIVFSYGNLKVVDMAKTGFMLNIIGVLSITLALNTWGTVIFQLDTFPSWANTTRGPP